MKRNCVAVAVVAALALAGCSAGDNGAAAEPAQSDTAPTTSAPASPTEPKVTGTEATGLAVPWGMAFLPDGTAIVTERDTRRVVAIKDAQVSSVGTITAARPEGEGGLLGVAVSPDFASDQTLYFYFTTASDNRIATAEYANGRLGSLKPIVTGIPSGFTHNGGRMTFGPDGFLYVGTGDAGNSDQAQNYDSLGGKILRVTKSGAAAPGNPRSGSRVWSLGHRNVQGLAFDDTKQLWASEFGQSRVDELNKIQRGGNYGWPIVEGKSDSAQSATQFVDPELTWPVAAASPSGLAFANGALWMAGLRGERLWRIPVAAGNVGSPQDFFVQEFGRLRTVNSAPGGQIWVSTSNKDGRGSPAATDDRILAVTP